MICPPKKIPGTRNEIRALRNAGKLIAGVTYCVTDYNRGCLGAVAEIALLAINNSTLGHDASVLSSFDNTAWEGSYDIDTHRLFELNDNLGNRVSGESGTEVDLFPWGNLNVRRNIIHSADVYIDCDTEQRVYENRWDANAYTDLRGFEGVFENNASDSYARLYFNNATNVDYRRNKAQSFAYIYFNGQDDIFIRQNTIADNSYVRKFGGAGRFTLLDSLAARGDIRQYDGTLYINSVDTLSSGRIYQRGKGTLDVRYSPVSDLSYIDNRHAGADNYVRVWYSKYDSLAQLLIRAGVSAGNYSFNRHSNSGSIFDIDTSTADVTASYLEQNSNGYIYIRGAKDVLSFSQNNVTSRSEIRLIDISGTTAINYSSLDNYLSRLFLNGTVKATIGALKMMSNSRFTANGGEVRTSSVTVSSTGQIILNGMTTAGFINHTNVMSYSILTMSAASQVWRSTLMSQAQVDTAGFNLTRSTVIGNAVTTLTANNNNRHQLNGAAGLL